MAGRAVVAPGDEGSLGILRALRGYRAAAAAAFPGLTVPCLETWSILDHDALAVAQLLGHMEPAVVFEIGSFIGISAFHFAAQPNVRRVIAVDPNPLVRDEINQAPAALGWRIPDGRLDGVRAFDVAERVLAAYPEQRAKIELRTGVAAGGAGLQGSVIPIPTAAELGREGLVAFVDGHHSRAAVCADLSALFRAHPGALAVLDDCRYRWGLSVQAGVADFLEASGGSYRFMLVGDLHAALGRSNLGLVFSEEHRSDMDVVLRRFVEAFSRRFDVVAALEREDELIRLVGARDEELERLYASYSWQITRPLRRAWNVVQALVEKHRSD